MRLLSLYTILIVGFVLLVHTCGEIFPRPETVIEQCYKVTNVQYNINQPLSIDENTRIINCVNNHSER